MVRTMSVNPIKQSCDSQSCDSQSCDSQSVIDHDHYTGTCVQSVSINFVGFAVSNSVADFFLGKIF